MLRIRMRRITHRPFAVSAKVAEKCFFNYLFKEPTEVGIPTWDVNVSERIACGDILPSHVRSDNKDDEHPWGILVCH